MARIAVAGGDHGRVGDFLDPEVAERAQTRRYSAEYKLKILAEYETLDKLSKGALLRREGLYTSLLSVWRQQRDKGALAALEQKRGRQEVDPRARELERLRREKRKLESELDKARHVIRIQGELSALLKALANEGAESDSEPTR